MRPSFWTNTLAALAGVAMLGATMSEPASAFTIASPSMGEHFSAAGHVDKVWWCRWNCGWGWRRPWGWGPGAVVAGAVVGTAAAAAAYNNRCWRRVWGPYGWQWARVC
jgi:hypothetical protein